MTKYLAALPFILAIGLTGCGEKKADDYSVIKKACLAEGDEAVYCNCYVKALDDNISSTVAQRIAKSITEEGKTRTEAEDALPASDLRKIQTLFPVIWQCLDQNEKG